MGKYIFHRRKYDRSELGMSHAKYDEYYERNIRKLPLPPTFFHTGITILTLIPIDLVQLCCSGLRKYWLQSIVVVFAKAMIPSDVER